MKQENRKKKAKNIIILTAAVILAGIAGAAASVPLSVINKYRKTSYEYVEIVEREDEYVMEAYPEVIIDTSGTWQEGLDLPDDTEKYESSAESIAEPVPESEPVSVPETEAESIAEPVPEPEPASVPETETEIQPEPAAESVPVPETEVPAKEETAKPAETAAETEAVQQPAEQTGADTIEDRGNAEDRVVAEAGEETADQIGGEADQTAGQRAEQHTGEENRHSLDGKTGTCIRHGDNEPCQNNAQSCQKGTVSKGSGGDGSTGLRGLLVHDVSLLVVKAKVGNNP
jgi:outer membrane biosynthesis protein TonB